uniref:Lipopolysaccharide biosynthesis protein n=1 Tax=Desulfovibrio sp. U5L TaxID=596152 RepID=I2Q7R7_9BACT
MPAQDDSLVDAAIRDERNALRRENTELHRENALLRQRIAVEMLQKATAIEHVNAVKHHENELEATTAGLRNEITKIYASSSWRITKPLRQLRQLLSRTGRPLFRKQVPEALSTDPPDNAAAQPTQPIGVFLHLYYEDLAGELAGYIGRVPDPKRVYVSTDTPEKAGHIRRVFTEAGLGEMTEIRVVPNRGFDIGPFLVGFGKEIQQHDIIVRLHGKKSTQLGEEAGTVWRRMLLDSLLGDATRVEAILAALRRRPDLGLVCPEHWDGLYALYESPIAIGSNLVRMAELLARYNVPLSAGTPIDFPSGSMFWCRRQALAPWLRFGFTWDSFETSGEEARDASLAHALERLFLFGCGLENLSWARADRLPTAPYIV